MDMMNGKILKQGYTFDDVLLVPAYSEVMPKQVDISTRLTEKIALNVPLLSAAMDTVTESPMAIGLALLGGLGIIHKNMSIQQQAQQVLEVKTQHVDLEKYPSAALDSKHRLLVGAAIGVSDDLLERVDALVNAGVDIVALDSAHGHSLGVIQSVRKVRENYPDLDIMAGNIISAAGATDLIYAGATCVKVGVGPGSICTTRV
ncbi:MAG TPA: IMP dehydrogenase, partial [Erysipelothrix sp.]|nr:IMP dehydrogenase [Erysipelothrix sp.]